MYITTTKIIFTAAISNPTVVAFITVWVFANYITHLHTSGDEKFHCQLEALVQKRAVLPVGKPLQSRFHNREHECGSKGPLL